MVVDDVLMIRQMFADQCESAVTKQSYLDGFHDRSDLFLNALTVLRIRNRSDDRMKRVWDSARVKYGFLTQEGFDAMWKA